MKKILIILLLLLGSYSNSIGQEEVVTQKISIYFERFYDSGQIQQSGYISLLNVYDTVTCLSRVVSVTDSIWLLYDYRGKLIQKGYYQEGLKIGVWEYYMEGYIGQAVYIEGQKVRYLEVSDTGQLIYLKDF